MSRVSFIVCLCLLGGCGDDGAKSKSDDVATANMGSQASPPQEEDTPADPATGKADAKGSGDKAAEPTSQLDRPGELPRPPVSGKLPAELRPPR